jgi:hypothetical protein
MEDGRFVLSSVTRTLIRPVLVLHRAGGAGLYPSPYGTSSELYHQVPNHVAAARVARRGVSQ